MPDLLVAITLDCEPPNAEGLPGVTGPADWEAGAAFMRAYCEIAAAAGFPASLFLHPEVAYRQPALLFELERAGVSISGLHLHPWKYDPETSLTHLGLMPAGPQRAIVARAAEEWAQGLGRRPGFFRPGTFSANDATAGIAAELGFAGVSMSVPGRSFPDLGAIWVGCPPDPHRMHPAMRLLEGAMALPNMPLSVDFSQTRRRGNRSWHPDLRPDQAYDDLPGSVARVVDQILSRAPAVPVLNIVTHNDNDYTDPADPARRNLEAILAAIRAAAGERGAACRGAAIEDVCARVAALPPPEPAFVRT